MSAALGAKLFNTFKEITDAARSAVSRHIYPILQGGRARKEDTDAVLAERYEEWQAGCRAAARVRARTLYPNEGLAMPKMPVDDEEHQPCRQMAAVLIDRTIYQEQVAGRWFDAAAEAIKNYPACANHPKTCACQLALEGWTYASNQMQVQLLKAFYKAHYDREKDEGYLQAVRDIADTYGITFEQMLEKERAEKAVLKADVARGVALKKAIAETAAGKAKLLEECVFICYQDFDSDLEKYNNGKGMHGNFRVVKTATHHEFTIMDTGGMEHPSWHKAVANKEVWRFPLEVEMGVKGTTFECVTPDKIHTA